MRHHLCIQDDYCTFDGETIPIGKRLIEKEITKAISDVLEMVVHKVGKDEVVVCGVGDAKRMLGRKLEDRLGRKVEYE
jgi:predicted ThiF/HesA family dinucleotide-utilizing enzyme